MPSERPGGISAAAHDLLKQWLAAGTANALTSALLNPFDVAKTRMQCGRGSASLLATLSAMAAQGGAGAAGAVRGLFFPGLPASLVREYVSSGVRAGLYVPVRDALLERGGGGGDGAGAKVAAALACGAAGAVLANPIDVVKVRLMVSPHAYASTAGALRSIAADEGVAGLAKGLLPSTLRASAIAAGELATYDIAKTALRRWLARDGGGAGGGGGEGAALHVAASLITGAVASVVAAPFDLIKARAMAASGTRETLRSVVRGLAREGGFPLSLFRGVLPAYLRLGPHALICFPLLEQLRRALNLDYI
jgi:hypothetical protein